MANPLPHTSPGLRTSTARRTSYASVAGGAGGPSNITSRQAARGSNRSPDQASSQRLVRIPPIPREFLANAPLPPDLPQLLDTWGEPTQQPYLSPFQFIGNQGGAFMDGNTQDFFTPSYLRGSRFMERLQEKYRATSNSQKEHRPTRSSANGSLSTSASSVNIQKVVQTHRGMALDVQEKEVIHKEDGPQPLPLSWGMVERSSGIEVLNDGLEIKYNDKNKTDDSAAGIRTQRPIPRQCGIYYFEVTVMSKNKQCQIGVGLSGPRVALSRMPGWEPESWGYHSDDGHAFNQHPQGKTYGPEFGYHDVVGCGINFTNNQIFFTRNGVYLGIAFREVKAESLHPTIAMKRAGEHVKVNLGQQPFVFDINNMVNREKRQLQERINKVEFAQSSPSRSSHSYMPEIIAQYLVHEGYVETAKVFNEEVQSTRKLVKGNDSIPPVFEHKEDLNAINRQVIRAAILEGNIDKALKHTKAWFPSVLLDNDHIYFKLRCRKFIEMIRRCTLLQPRSKRSSLHKPSRPSTSNGNSTNDYNDVFDGRMELDEDQPGTKDHQEDPNGKNSEVSGDTISKQNELMVEALQYGQELRAEFKDDYHQGRKKELEETFALIAYPDARDSSLAPLLETSGRIPVAEELSSAILVSLGQSSTAAIERLLQQTEVLIDDLSTEGGPASLLNVTKDYVR